MAHELVDMTMMVIEVERSIYGLDYKPPFPVKVTAVADPGGEVEFDMPSDTAPRVGDHVRVVVYPVSP